VATWSSVAIGLGVPVVGILVLLPLVANTDVVVLGVPLLFLVLFAMMPISTLALWVAWRIDSPRYESDAVIRTRGGEDA
jgi:hypothetical protein